MEKIIEIEGIYSGSINFAFQQNYVPIVKKLIIKSISEKDIYDVDIVITTEPNFAYEWTMKIDKIPACQAVELDTINIKLSSNFLYGLTEKMVGTIFINIKKDEEMLLNINENIEILAYDQWSGLLVMPEIITAFITPNHSKITEIIIKSKKILEKWCGNPSFTGYQSNNPNVIKMQMAAIYAALQSENISYCMPPASFEDFGQRVRLVDQALQQKLGTCLDLSLLYASCLEAVGLNTMIIFTKGHAFIGCWLENQCFSECVQEDVSLLTKRIAEGINEICLVECTCFVAGRNVKFDDAVKAGENNLIEKEFYLLVDVKRTRGSGITPIPLRKISEDGEFVCDNFEASQDKALGNMEDISAPKELEVFGKINEVDHIDVTRQQIWERKLLDLSLRNTLINFRVTKSTIQLIASHLSELEDALASGEEFKIMAKPKDFENTLRDSKIYTVENQTSLLENLIKSEFANRRMRTFLSEEELTYSITNLYRQAKLSLEENGANTLYLALGFLKWYESDISERARYAPIVLIPIEILRKSAQKGYGIRIRDEEIQVNITLLEMLRQDFGLSIAGLDPLPTHENGIDLKKVFNIIRQAVMTRSRWDVEELAFVGLFSFSQFIMWNDIRNRTEDLKKNKIVASLLSGKMEWTEEEGFPSPDTLDEVFTPKDVAVPISADSSQLSAICAAGKDKSFVLHGPPGTGKSQTITNIIANALFQGKSVLFIAEKMAALSVVQKRLESIGLAPFCLELHSNKAKKKDVLNQLEQCLNIGKIKSSEQYEKQAAELYELRKELNNVVEAIHKKRHFGFSLYEAISHYEQYKDYSDCIKFKEEKISKVTPDIYRQWEDIIKQLKAAGNECGGVYNNPLKEFTNSNYSQTLKGEISEILKNYRVAIDELKKTISSISELIGVNTILAYDKVCGTIKLVTLLKSVDYIPLNLFESEELSLLKSKVYEVCSCGKKRDEAKEKLLKLFSEEILSFDNVNATKEWKLAETSWFVPRIIGQNKVAKALKIISNNPGKFDKKEVLSYLKLVEEYKTNLKTIEENNILFKELFGLLWNDSKADWTLIQGIYNSTEELNEIISTIFADGTERREFKERFSKHIISNLSGFKQNNVISKNCMEIWKEVDKLENSLTQKAGINFNGFKNNNSWLTLIEEKARVWFENLDGLRNWCTYLNIKAAAEKAELENVFSAYDNGLVKEDSLLPCFYRGISQAFAMYIVDKERCLSEFNGVIFEEIILKYKQSCSDFAALTKNELIARLSSKVPTTTLNPANSSELGILQRAIRSGGRMLSIRKLFDSIPNLLRKLCPCMLMSPISVAQYIDPKYPEFDLVVFDEASQMPTCEAVGAIARGKNVIVVGDPKQLPPTSFFNANRVDEENFEKEDLESILDDCLALSMPQEHLLWHYRSRHESLIAFSNMQYYDNKLLTFPSPKDLVSAVKFIHVEGYYDRGKTKHNKAEAEAIVKEIIRRLSHPVLSKESIGVVTFSSVQQNLIDDLLTEAFSKNPELEKVNNKAYEPIFIKNLENVQGDERDVILFSIGYGPDLEGKVGLNFGPLNRDGGWRRLNVAVSRARKEMIVYSTLRPEQIDLSRTRSQGIAGLKAFLTFARNGKNSLPIKISTLSNGKDALEKLISEKIKSLGYEVHTNIGCSEYKIDIGIVNPQKKGEYILGIMCDGDKYKAANTSRDRNILQGHVLKTLGWNIYRLWILDWWENPEGELKKIESAIKKAQAEPKDDQIVNADVLENNFKELGEVSFDAAVEENPKYTLCVLESEISGAEEFCSTKNNKVIIEQIEKILHVEAPISRNLLCKRIISAWGISRMGSRLERRFEELFSIMKLTKTKSNDLTFYWDKEQVPSQFKLFRVPSDDTNRRNIEDICVEEISNAIKYTLESQISLLKSDLIRETYKLFGFSRGSASIEKSIMEGVDSAVENDFVYVDGNDRVILKE